MVDPQKLGLAMSKTILFVDDSSTQRVVMCTALREAGYECLEAEDGQKALDLLETGAGLKIQLIICDVNMPNMDGLEFARRVKAHEFFSKIPFVMLTTEAGENIKSQGMQIGIRAWATKPCAPEKLLKAVQKLIP